MQRSQVDAISVTMGRIARARMARWHQFQLRSCSGYLGPEPYPALVHFLVGT
jgi:hypothetical protein